MKKQILLILLCCLLTGCVSIPADQASVQNVPSSAPPPAAAEPAPEEPCVYTVEMMDREDSAADDDGTLLATYRVHMPVLIARRSGGGAVETAETEAEVRALAAAETFNAQFAPWTGLELLEELTETARFERAWRQEAQIEWVSELYTELDCQVYQTERLVSTAGNYYSYTGGAHPNTVLMAWNFDLETGAFFAPEQLAEDSEAFSRAVSEEIVRQLPAAAAAQGLTVEEMFWSNYEEIIAGWSSYAVSFDREGMNVGFSPYELAAYAAGSQCFCLPYDLLAPWLSDYGRAVLGLGEA